ncbi:uncharacterized protein LACBIDRAFT_300931 [Laccaria bicolor S238N-H82]|uniref:Predicted protein n=1 Tax=Laccaria bicolor (strain S238N-H82 / ATCC MYA-4686) TaxID=486041 RepID=B0CQX3_LACBS|nr:uncharacterized protein LACBIDRAFT_300931 [Laccaria bicolor S238N-H82]EDR15109.1 predicted protein [Laccaria bicolor S238N-H82]|eukprot:XP_001873317.1 predicted protein [Laccaria bicolor S238N-H82]
MRFHAILLLLPPSLAFQLPFSIPFFRAKSYSTLEDDIQPSPPSSRIAIIGAGAGGSSAAFWISKAKERFGLEVEIDVYERADYIGGRSTVVYPYSNSSLPPLELGASIFVSANKNLWRAAEEFNLTREDNVEDDFGIWDGDQLLLSFGGGWWDTAKVLWRYGFLSPRRTSSLVRDMISRYLTLYTLKSPRWNNMSDLAVHLGWEDLLETSTSSYLVKQGVSESYVNELVEASTRVNYGQDVDDIHALGGVVSMAAEGAVHIKGGNYQLFEQFLNHSGANVYLNTSVTSILPKSATSQNWVVRSDRGSTIYKAVILAAPFHTTDIALPSAVSDQILRVPYVHLHVTLLTTTSPSANPAYFNLSAGSKVPAMMLTTNFGARNGGKKPEFNSLSYHGLVREGEWAVKIFSKERISDGWLQQMFDGQVGWIHRKEWDAYPRLPPTGSFPPIKLEHGFYYVNAFEPFVSTMETETVASRNVVDLLLNEEFSSGICDITSPTPGEELFSGTLQVGAGEDPVFGWDC